MGCYLVAVKKIWVGIRARDDLRIYEEEYYVDGFVPSFLGVFEVAGTVFA